MLGERPVAEYGIALAALGALIFVVRAILNYLTFVHNNPQKESQTNNFASIKDRFIVGAKQIDDISEQIDDMFRTWSPERAKQMTDTHTYILKMETLEMHKHETMKELLKESRKTNALLEKFIALQTQEHNIIIRDIGARKNSFSAPR